MKRVDRLIVAGVAAALMAAAAQHSPGEPGRGGSGGGGVGERLGIPKSEMTKAPVLKAFAGLPEPKASGYKAAMAGRINAGTDGLSLPLPALAGDSPTIAILGDLAPQPAGARDRYLKMAVSQLNLLRPDLVLSVGNLVPGVTRDGEKYVEEVGSVRKLLETLKMPWYPCAGVQDIFSGTRLAEDRRFEELYRKYQGPLYYSVDAGSVHVVVLDSEEMPGGRGISEAQLAWLKSDLNRVFDADRFRAGGGKRARAPWIVVVVHRPLWRLEREQGGVGGGAGEGPESDWSRVHEALVQFNRRPIVSLEGIGGSTGAEARGPQVVAVVAGGERAYSMEPTRDGIRYYVLGPTAAMPRLGEDASVAVRGFMLVKLDGSDEGNGAAPGGGGEMGSTFHPAIVELGGEGPASETLGAIVGEDIVVAREREVLDEIAGWGNEVMGIDGFLDERPGGAKEGPGKLLLHLHNPTKESLDLSLRMASTKFLASPSRRDAANPYVEGLDLPWDLTTGHIIRHLAPGQTDGWPIGFERSSGEAEAATSQAAPVPAEEAVSGGGIAPPQMEIVVRWSDPRSRVHEVVLKRRAGVAPAARVTVVKSGEELWKGVASGNAYAWEVRGDEPRKLNPTWQMTADAERFYVRVQADDGVHSYWPQMVVDRAWGGPASDAVKVTFAAEASAKGAQEVWLFPFAPRGSELWTGTGEALLKVDPATGITAQEEATATGYEATLSIPRKLLVGSSTPAPPLPPPPPATPSPAGAKAVKAPHVAATVFMNLTVYDNDEGGRTWQRSWAPQEPAAWGRVDLIEPEKK